MEESIRNNIEILAGQDILSATQRKQFRQIIMEGLKGKFTQTLFDDTDSMLAVVDIWIRYGFLPMDETFCAVDKLSGDVMAILLLNNFKGPNAVDSVRCLMSVCRTIGFKKALKIAFNFLALDTLNKKMPDHNTVSEIYLVSTREDQRGKGVGTVLMDHVLDHLKTKCRCGSDNGCGCRVKLLVFAKNPALRLYERLGFIKTGFVDTPKIEKAFGSDYDALLVMERPLQIT